MKGFWKRLRTIDLNRSAALTAVFVSICALYVSIQQTRMMRTQQRVSSYPHLTLFRSYSADGFAVKIKNSGTGLAFVNGMQLTDGERFFADWPDVLEAYLPDSLSYGYGEISANTINGEVITPGEEIVLFATKWRPGIRQVELATRELTMRICYASLLEERWLLENEDRQLIKGTCPLGKDQAFN